MSAQEWVLLAVPLGIIGLIVLYAILSVPLQAYARGQGFAAWFLLQIVSFNPIYPMLLVALLPNKARAKLREKFAAELDEKLKRAGPGATPTAAAPIDRSLGDLPTTDPGGPSVGDVETQATSGPNRR